MPANPHGWTIFCDDIREEVGGKSSFIGVYKGSLIVHSAFPVTLPKFALAVHYRFAIGDQRSADVEIRVFLPGDNEDAPSLKAVIPLERLIRAERSPPDSDDEFRVFNANIILTPVRLRQTGRITVRAVGGAGLVELGALKVEQRLATEQPTEKGSP